MFRMMVVPFATAATAATVINVSVTSLRSTSTARRTPSLNNNVKGIMI